MSTDDLAHWLRLLDAPGVGRVRARKLLQTHGSVAAAAAQCPLAAPTQQLIDRVRFWLDAADDRSLLTLGDPDYPAALLQSPDPPLLLYLEGQRAQLAGPPGVAVVGTRHPTPQGREHARQFARDLAARGQTVVSGLALGIDAEAHAGALQAGRTWAVLGSGLDCIHPRSHAALAQSIRAQGLLISEHPPGTQPLPAHFPARNRVIAGLSWGCLVVEAASKSGSLITARLAVEAGREVFALPGPLRSPVSQGCHELIQQGAKLVLSVDDLLAEQPQSMAALPHAAAPLAVQPASGLPEDAVLQALGWEPCSLDALQARTGWPTDRLLARLLDLELDGALRQLPGGRYERVARG